MADGRVNNGSKPGERRGGRQKGTPNKSTNEIKELAQRHCPEVLAEFARIFKDKKADLDSRIKVGVELLNRGYGRPAQQLQHAGHDGGPLDLSLMSDEALAAALARLNHQEEEKQQVRH